LRPDLERIARESGSDTCLIIGWVFERDVGWFKRMHDELLVEFNRLILELGFSNISFVCNSQNLTPDWHRGLEMFARARHTVFVDYFMLKTYRMQRTQDFSQAWNSAGQKALFLTGKPHKSNRAPLLSKFYDSDNLHCIEWSLHTDKFMNAILYEKFFQHYTPEQFDTFIELVTRNPDNASVMYQWENCHYHGFPFDTGLYSDTLFSIVSETDYDNYDSHWLTEKTWRTMANWHPFVFVGTSGSMAMLEQMGFVNFRNFLKLNDHESGLDLATKLQRVHDNVLDFFKVCQNNEQQISKAVKHNYDLFCQLAKQHEAQLQFLLTDLNVRDITVDDIIDQSSFREYNLQRFQAI
jgi:hypothetical protein